MKPFNCLRNSAWHTWQTAGYKWKKNNPTATKMGTNHAALDYAAIESAEIAQSARRRAFLEGANQ